jgi:predicted RNase H-like HicB family nuclease
MTQIESCTDAAAAIQHAIEGYAAHLRDINRKVFKMNYVVPTLTGIIP